MIKRLEIGRSGYFYQCKQRLSKGAIDKLFRAIRKKVRQPSRNLFRANRVILNEACYSAICFSYERDVSFLALKAGVVERVFGFVLIIEHGQHVAVFKSGLDIPPAFKKDFLGKIANDRIECAIARHDAVFEKLRLRNMSISPLALRSKTLEARDLENAVAASSASRFVPQGYSVRREDGVYSTTISSGRISVRSDRVEINDAVAWAVGISKLLETGGGTVAGFIRNFARPVELSALRAQLCPTFVGIDTMGLADALFSVDGGIRLIRKGTNGVEALSQADSEALLAALEPPFSIASDGCVHQVGSDGVSTPIGTLSMGSRRITLKTDNLTTIAGISVERRAHQLGEDVDAITLARYLDRENLFTVLFSDLTLAYIDGALFRDEALTGGGAALLAHLRDDQSLQQTSSEKGGFTPNQIAFTEDSVFRSVVDTIARDDDVLICDDLGDEWADFIGVSTSTSPTMISFYHAKHGKRSLGASAFHDSVGQAIKNLGRMCLPNDMLRTKLEKWNKHYCNDKVQTQIARMIRGGTPEEISEKLDKVRSAPDVLQRAFIVTSSLSRTEVQNVLAKAEKGTAPEPHFVQLYWLLMSYFSACTEMGVRGYVVCRP